VQELAALVGQPAAEPHRVKRQKRRRAAWGERQEVLLDLLRCNPGLSRGQLAQTVYGSDTPVNRKKIRGTLYILRAAGKIRGGGKGGRIEVIDSA